MPLVSLEEYNAEKRKKYAEMRSPHFRPTGIACPKCSAELYDESGFANLSFPPSVNVRCKNCDFVGSRIS